MAKKKNKILISIAGIILGWLLNAFAWTTKLGHPTSTICLLLGLGLFFSGLIFAIVGLHFEKKTLPAVVWCFPPTTCAKASTNV